jgi:hypothetical protein
MRTLALLIALLVGSAAYAQTEQRPTREREVLQHRPSGFWTSNRPAEGGAYRWRLLGVGIVLAIGSGLLMRRLIKRANAERTRSRP